MGYSPWGRQELESTEGKTLTFTVDGKFGNRKDLNNECVDGWYKKKKEDITFKKCMEEKTPGCFNIIYVGFPVFL